MNKAQKYANSKNPQSTSEAKSLLRGYYAMNPKNELNIKFYKLPWWKRILFFFLKTHRGTDCGYDDKTCITEWKIWRGKYYLINQTYE